jgi:hypothetical protein
MDLVVEELEVAQLGIAEQKDIAAPTPVSPIRAPSGDVLLSAEGNAAVPAVPSRYMDLGLIEEHERILGKASPAADCLPAVTRPGC